MHQKPTIIQLPKKLNENLNSPIYTMWALSKLTLEEFAVYRAIADLPVPEWYGTLQDLADYLNIGYRNCSHYVNRLHKKGFIGWKYIIGQPSRLYWVRRNSEEIRPDYKDPEEYKLKNQHGQIKRIYRGAFRHFAQKNQLTLSQISNLVAGRRRVITAKNGDKWTLA